MISSRPWGRSASGSHIIMVKGETVVPVPKHDQIKRGLLMEIIAEAGLSKEEFLALL